MCARKTIATRLSPMDVLLIPDTHKIDEKLIPSQGLPDQLTQLGIHYSQGLALSEHGRFTEIYYPF